MKPHFSAALWVSNFVSDMKFRSQLYSVSETFLFSATDPVNQKAVIFCQSAAKATKLVLRRSKPLEVAQLVPPERSARPSLPARARSTSLLHLEQVLRCLGLERWLILVIVRFYESVVGSC